MFGHAIEELGRFGRQAMLVVTWALTLIALALATWATIASGRAQEPGPPAAAARVASAPPAERAQPAFSNQNVSGR